MAPDSTKTTWTDEKGYERGVTVCGDEASTHPSDSAGGLDFCADCGRNTCASCRTSRSGASICTKCAGAASGRRKKSSRSKPKRAGAKRRTVARLRRVGGGVRRGYGVFKHGAAPRTYEKGGNEKFTAFAFGHRGNSLGKWTASSIIGAMTKANESAPAGVGVTIRGEFTSDGTHHGLGKGRVAMVRENGRWIWM